MDDLKEQLADGAEGEEEEETGEEDAAAGKDEL